MTTSTGIGSDTMSAGTAQEVQVAGFVPDHPDRGYLLGEPCRFCHRAGGVWFVIDDSPFGRCTPQVVACDLCHATWDVNGRLPL